MLMKALILAYFVCASLGCSPDTPRPEPPRPDPPRPDPPGHCQCGKANTRKRIVGGQETEENEYPWQVLIQQVYTNAAGRSISFMCGGSVITNKAILTAAHCVHETKEIEDKATGRMVTYTAQKFIIKLGVHNQAAYNDPNVETITVSRDAWGRFSQIKSHSDYDRRSKDNDIAIILLGRSIRFTQEISPVCLPRSNYEFNQIRAVVSGWGATSFQGSSSSVLRHVQVNTISNRACCDSNQGNLYHCSQITRSMLCSKAPNKDSCQGDSGGPLSMKKSNNYVQIGVVSWGKGCAWANYPGIYQRTGFHLGWIKQMLRYDNAGEICQK